MNIARPSAVILPELRIMMDCAGFEMATRCGKPNSKMEYSALKNGINPPKVVAVATNRVGTCWRAKWENIADFRCFIERAVNFPGAEVM